MSNRPRLPISLAVVLAGGLLGNCSALDRLKNVGEQPSLSAIENPTAQPGYKPVQMPMPAPQPAVFKPNSLWRNGSRAFFKDQRAMQVGDIMTVKVKITDNAKFENGTSRSRSATEDFRHQGFHRLEDHHAVHPDPAGQDPDRRLDGEQRGQGIGEPPGGLAHQRSGGRHAGAAERQSCRRGQAGGAGQLRNSRADRRRHRAAGGHRKRQHDRLDQDRASPHRLRRPRPDHRRPAAALRPAGARCARCRSEFS